MTYQQKLRKSLKWKIMRIIWIYPKTLSLWASKKLIAWSVEASNKDGK